MDLGATMGVLTRGDSHPTARIDHDGALWITTRTGDDPLTARFSRVGPGTELNRDVHVQAWGLGAEAFMAEAPRWAGEGDDWTGLRHGSSWDLLPESLRRARSRHPGVRLIATGRLVETLVNAVLEQRVTGGEAVRAQRWLARAHGDPAPGPVPEGMRVFPSAATIRRIPSWAWHRAGVDPARSRTIQNVVERAAGLDRWNTVALGPDLQRAVGSIPGVGPWTLAQTLQITHGDPDSVSVYDYHLAHHVTEFFDGHRGEDARMLELLEPWSGHRQRVVRLLYLSGWRPQAKGPRLSPEDRRHM
ncbi:hypothetical protein EDL96_05775 [Kocuria soli]|uniref:DNA-3-methyladenine glycosylase 2 family protein n=1 Tax=Kocuria soli TaxID=2485125 RepID=A0A3N3ZY13_9MICC|nr:hypothetical protein EDL96_05775 [Kocuria soli]